MKAKTIKSLLRRKFDAFCDSIEDKPLRELVRVNTIITGGSIASMLLREPVNDYDLYFRTYEVTLAVAEYYVKQFKKNPPPKLAKRFGDNAIKIEVVAEEGRVRICVKSAGVAGEAEQTDYKYFEMAPNPDSTDAHDYVDKAMGQVQAEEDITKPAYRPVFLSDNAVTLSNRVQLILRFYGEPNTIHENYDFIHCTGCWTSWDGHLELPAAMLEALLTKELRYVGSRYPLCSLIRTRKFVARGFTINGGQFLKMAWQLGQLDLSDPNVLEDQLTGVDTAYFLELVHLLRERDKDRVDGTYLMELVDRIF